MRRSLHLIFLEVVLIHDMVLLVSGEGSGGGGEDGR